MARSRRRHAPGQVCVTWTKGSFECAYARTHTYIDRTRVDKAFNTHVCGVVRAAQKFRKEVINTHINWVVLASCKDPLWALRVLWVRWDNSLTGIFPSGVCESASQNAHRLQRASLAAHNAHTHTQACSRGFLSHQAFWYPVLSMLLRVQP